MNDKTLIANLTTKAFHDTMMQMQYGFEQKMQQYGALLFTTNAQHLWSTYLNTFHDEVEHKEHDCHRCREFVRQYGNLVFINDVGNTIPAYWDSTLATPEYADHIRVLEDMVKDAVVTGSFYSYTNELGRRKDGGFNHFNLILDTEKLVVRSGSAYSAYELMAFSKENYRTLMTALSELDTGTLEKVLHLIDTNAVANKESVRGIVAFLLDLRRVIERNKKIKNRDHYVHLNTYIRKVVATAPSGFCTPRSNVIWELIEAVKYNTGVDRAVRAVSERTNSDVYQRPTAVPTEGNINQAEKLIERMGLKDSLKRRLANIEDVSLLWEPNEMEVEESNEGVFGKLRNKSKVSSSTDIGQIEKMTWEKFRRKILPQAIAMEFYVPSGNSNFVGMMTAEVPESLPILQWDTEENRNQVSSYTYVRGSTPDIWSLPYNQYVKVVGITPLPWMRDDEEAFSHLPRGILLILEDAEDKECDSLCLFPQLLRNELHSIRSTVEAYSNATVPASIEGQKAAGVCVSDRQALRLRVTTRIGSSTYLIDRMD